MNQPSNAPPPPPELRCKLVEELGSGTTGSVWRAQLTAPLGDLPEGTEIALKRLHAASLGNAALRAAFEREGQAALAVHSPGVVRGIASGTDEHGPWIALRHVPGRTLRQQLDAFGSLPEPQVRALAERLAGALATLHGAGYLHGDLKPDNVRFDAEGRAVLLDLGFLLPLEPDGNEQRISGSLPYLSPEELRGARATPASEIFSLGTLLYEAATGTHPFANAEQLADADKLPHQLLEASFEVPSLRVPTLSPFLDHVLEAMLDGDAQRRPTLDEFQSIARKQEASHWWRRVRDESSGPVARVSYHSASSLPLVGRQPQLAQLLAAAKRLSAARNRAGNALRVVGRRGAGKSRLIREFARRVRVGKTPPLYLQGRCSSFQEARPCQPILTLLSRYLGLPGGTVPGEREREQLDGLLPSAERDTLLGALDPAYEGTTSSSVPAALSAWLVALACETTMVIYLDDFEFADGGTLEILTRLIGQLESVPLLLLLGSNEEETTRRPEAQRMLEERIERLPESATIRLDPLAESDVLELVSQLFTNDVPRLRLASVLWQRSHGNAGLIAEILRGLLDRGQAVPGEHGLSLTIHPDQLPLPKSLREETARAYARLDPHDRLWLARLAVSGGRIQSRFLLRAWPKERASDLDLTLARLTSCGWLRPEGDRYQFRRPAQRAAIYKRLSGEQRKTLHAAVARALRPGPGGKLSLTDAFQRAYHLRSAGEFRELLQILRPLLKRLLDRGQPARVHTLGLWGLEALDALPSDDRHEDMAMEFLWAAADAADRLGYREKQRQLLDQLERFDMGPEAQPERRGRVYLLHARYAISTGQYQRAEAMLQQAIQNFEQAASRELHASALLAMAAVQTHEGDFPEARRLARQALDNAPNPWIAAQAELALGVRDMLMGRIESSLKRGDRCLILLRDTERFEALALRARAHSMRARIYRGAGRPRRGLVSAQHALRFARRAGDRRLEIELQARLGVHLLDIDRVEEAERLLRDTLLISMEIEDRRSESICTLFLGILLGEQGDPGAAKMLARCSRVSRRIGNTRTEAVCISMQSRILYQTDPERALGHSNRAVGLLERAGAELIDRIVIRGTHAMILEATGHEAEFKLEVLRLRRRMRAGAGRIESPLLQRRLRLATGQLLRAALSPEGPVYRRVHLDRT